MKYTTDEMVLLDRFACEYIPAPNNRPSSIWEWCRWAVGKDYKSKGASYKDIARNGYEQAEAMLQERKKYIQ